MQKHNLSPRESLLSAPSLPPPSPLVGAETRRRKARRRELEGCVVGEGNQTLDQHQEAKELQGNSDTEVCACALCVPVCVPDKRILQIYLTEVKVTVKTALAAFEKCFCLPDTSVCTSHAS